MILLIDNYDSFTYNLVHYLGEIGADCSVHRNDQISVEEARALEPGAIVLSPGPCDPSKAGICLDLIKAVAGEIPLFGVCLGHQAIAEAFGGRIVRAPYPMHGKVSKIEHRASDIFRGLPSPFEATRYHSLIVERETLPDCLDTTAWTSDGIIMGLAHKSLPIWGVQFHPESIATQYGHTLLRNFLELSKPTRPLAA